MNFGTRWTLPILCLITLTACQGTATVTRTAPLEVTKVVLPESVGASAEMNIDLTVGEGCSQTVPDVVAERTDHTLRLTVQRTTTVSADPVSCLPVYNFIQKTHTDPGTPPRTNPFEVFVNGKSYGTVLVR